MDSFDKIKDELDRTLERARSKVQNRVEAPHSARVKSIRARARERLAAIKSGSKGLGTPSSSPTLIRDTHGDTTQIRSVDEPATIIKDVTDEGNMTTVIREESEGASTEVGDSHNDATMIVERELNPTKMMQPEDAPDFVEDDLSPLQRHQIDRAFAHLMHSVVKMCFYNLKIFCPSMADEFDEEVRNQVVSNIARLSEVKVEVDSFFAQTISDDRRIDSYYQDVAGRVQRDLISLIEMAQSSVDQLSDVDLRLKLARRIPLQIDAITTTLQEIRTELDASKCDVDMLLQQALLLTAETDGLTIDLDCGECPRIFANERLLINAFAELISNAVKYSEAENLKIRCAYIAESQMVEIVFEDDGKGMSEEECARCFERGFTTGGTGEGLAMVMEYIELEHLGSILVASTAGHGVQFTILLPVIFQNQSARRD